MCPPLYFASVLSQLKLPYGVENGEKKAKLHHASITLFRTALALTSCDLFKTNFNASINLSCCVIAPFFLTLLSLD